MLVGAVLRVAVVVYDMNVMNEAVKVTNRQTAINWPSEEISDLLFGETHEDCVGCYDMILFLRTEAGWCEKVCQKCFQI